MKGIWRNSGEGIVNTVVVSGQTTLKSVEGKLEVTVLSFLVYFLVS